MAEFELVISPYTVVVDELVIIFFKLFFSKAADFREVVAVYIGIINKTQIQGDRDWLSDNVYMRWELVYLIGAEAACRQGLLDDAKNFLFAITDQRVIEGQETVYDAWKATLTDETTLLDAIRHNWRIELWGEGYGLQTFRRFGRTVTLGSNHKRSDKELSPATPRKFTFELPTGELYYNPFIRQETSTDGAQIMRKQH